jgi:thiol-disulfide isomerase/thioredoxin
VKKTGVVLICLCLGLVLGCKKKPLEPEPVQLPPAVVSSTDVPAVSNTDALPATAKTESVPVTKNEPAPTDRLAWMTDFAAAQKKAAAEGKDLFINFTGSDWCGWCKRLDKEVFSKPLFIYEAQKHFVFVYLDFPRNKPQSDTLKAQNEKLAQRYEAQGFPTIILATADGSPYGRTGYEEGGPLAYLQGLAKLQQKKPAK